MKSKDPLHVTLAKLIALYGRRLLRPRQDGDESPMHQGLARCGRGKQRPYKRWPDGDETHRILPSRK